MARIQTHHSPGCGLEGKCSRPMWWHGTQVFCDAPAFGERYSERDPSRGQSGRYADPSWPPRDRNGYYPPHLAHLAPPYVPAFACSAHGGPSAEQIRFVRDGNAWCAFLPGFVNLQESVAGFGSTQDAAESDLRAALSSAASDAQPPVASRSTTPTVEVGRGQGDGL